ncbi:MAG: PQQ-like beta-propeller repeat protein [Gemmataceae bacterium]|nr:PQQ-like beta-propeller repeat protein [Gemmataceae bacterium]
MNTLIRSLVAFIVLSPALLSPALLAPDLRADDWPRFRGPRGNGAAAETTLPVKWGPKDNIAWKVELPGPGSSSPIVVGDRVYVTCFTGKQAAEIVRHVLCFDRAAGKLVWQKSFPAPQPENDYAKHLLQHGFATSTPVSDGERIYVHFGRDGVRAFDVDGKVVWHESVGKIISTFGSGATPLVFGDKLIVNATVELGALVALDKKTGKRRWKTPINGDCWSTPAIAELPGNKQELILNGSGAVYGFDPNDGKELWYVDSLGGHISSTPLIADGLIYVVNSGLNGKLTMAIRPGGMGDVTKTHIVWKQTKVGASHCSPLLLGDRLCWFSTTAVAVGAKDGSILLQKRLEGLFNLYSSPVAAGDTIALFTRSGGSYVLRAADLEVLAENDLGDASGINASPALSKGQLFIRSNRHLYCIGTGK